VAGVSGAALATDPVAVGSGANTAYMLINFSDGANYQFDVSFDGETSGIGLFDIIESDTTLVTDRTIYGDDAFIDGVTYGDHSDVGFGGGEDWWHYWIRESDSDGWQSPGYGASSRTVTDGSWDGWVYGSAGEPVPEPTSLMVLAVAGGAVTALRRRRRRIHARN
ncbi:MAG: PEP-CTERM sorting domain-containing protein, partial [Phycisphaerae bacterium]